MKTLLPFLTVVMFSFGASAKDEFYVWDNVNCNRVKAYSLIHHKIWEEHAYSDNQQAYKTIILKEIDTTSKLATIYQAFCKD